MSENAWAFTDEEESTRESKSEFLKNKVIKLNIYLKSDKIISLSSAKKSSGKILEWNGEMVIRDMNRSRKLVLGHMEQFTGILLKLIVNARIFM